MSVVIITLDMWKPIFILHTHSFCAVSNFQSEKSPGVPPLPISTMPHPIPHLWFSNFTAQKQNFTGVLPFPHPSPHTTQNESFLGVHIPGWLYLGMVWGQGAKKSCQSIVYKVISPRDIFDSALKEQLSQLKNAFLSFTFNGPVNVAMSKSFYTSFVTFLPPFRVNFTRSIFPTLNFYTYDLLYVRIFCGMTSQISMTTKLATPVEWGTLDEGT